MRIFSPCEILKSKFKIKISAISIHLSIYIISNSFDKFLSNYTDKTGSFLADRTNGRAYASVASVCRRRRRNVMYCG